MLPIETTEKYSLSDTDIRKLLGRSCKIIEYNERQDIHSEQEMIDKIPELGPMIAETGKLLKMPGQSRTYGRWAKKESIGRQTLTKYVADFEAKCKELDENVEKYDRVKVQTNIALLQSALAADVLWDEITELIYHEDPKEYVYDFTVPGNDSFMVDCNVLVHNTLNKVLLRTGDCFIGYCIPYEEKQCKYNYGL
jgi:intein/homing endonuclease